MGLRRRVHEVLRVGSTRPVARTINASIVVLILLNVVAIILGTVQGLRVAYGPWLDTFEILSVAIFTVEYLARLWVVPEDPMFRGAVRGRLRWMGTPLAVVDLLAILPFYLPMGVALDLRFLRVLRLLRLVRVLKLARYSKAIRSMGRVFRAKRQELVMTLFLVGVLLVVSSSLMYLAEHEAQPEDFSSIPHTLWWAVITLTTVGYGDAVPITPLGRALGAVIALLGIGMIALPAGILGSGFVDELQPEADEDEALPTQAAAERARRGACPHCGKDLDQPPASSEGR